MKNLIEDELSRMGDICSMIWQSIHFYDSKERMGKRPVTKAALEYWLSSLRQDLDKIEKIYPLSQNKRE